MKKIALLLIAQFVVVAFVVAQIAVVSLMKVKPGGDDAYMAIEKEWKKLHQARVDEGKMIAWELYYIHNQGTNSEYNYATVNVYKDLPSAMAGISDDDLKKLGPKWNEVLTKTNASRDLVRDEVFSREMGIPSTAGDKYLTVSFMRINRPTSYYEMERDAYMPMHKAAIEDNKMTSWGIWRRAFPPDNEFQAVAVNGYKDINQIVGLSYEDLQEKLRQKTTATDLVKMVNLINDTEEIRTMIRTQLWESLDATTPKQ